MTSEGFRIVAGSDPYQISFVVRYAADQTPAIAALSTAGITDPTLLAAATGVKTALDGAAAIINRIDKDLTCAMSLNCAAIRLRIMGDAPISTSFFQNGLGALATGDRYSRDSVSAKFCDDLDREISGLWDGVMRQYVTLGVSALSTIASATAALTAAISAASPSPSLTAANAFQSTAKAISDALSGAVTADPFNRGGRSTWPFAVSVLPTIQTV